MSRDGKAQLSGRVAFLKRKKQTMRNSEKKKTNFFFLEKGGTTLNLRFVTQCDIRHRLG